MFQTGQNKERDRKERYECGGEDAEKKKMMAETPQDDCIPKLRADGDNAYDVQ